MKTPIADFVRKYADSECVRAHMPAHKGVSLLGVEKYDITEVDGADVLYHSKGIIFESEKNAQFLFGTARTLYSCEGSSLSIRAMLYLALVHAKKQGIAPLVFAGRNAHKAFLCACALLDMDIAWMWGGDEDMLSCTITPDSLERTLKAADRLPCAVYVTSPDYLGHIADIAGLSRVCREYGVLLLVDNAHGAYLHFLPESRHPMALGADICCDSAHKTLPVLTGGGYLHISEHAPRICLDSADAAMSLFASTSPSYLILQSLDLANAYISDGYREKLMALIEKTEKAKAHLARIGYTLAGDETAKITVRTKPYGYRGDEFADILRSHGIECEFSDPDYIVLMLSTKNTDEDMRSILCSLSSIPRKPEIKDKIPAISRPERVMTPRAAMLSLSCECDVRSAVGRVLAQPSVSCPPAIPVLVCGETIDVSAAAMFEYYGIEKCRIVI